MNNCKNKSFVNWFWCVSFLAFSLVGQNAFGEGIINSTKTILENNVEEFRSSGENLINAAQDLIQTINNSSDEVSKVFGDAANAKTIAIEQIQSAIKDVMRGDLEKLNEFNFSEIENSVNQLMSGTEGLEISSSEFVSKLKSFKNEADNVIHKAKSIALLAYTTPIGLRSDNLKFTLSIDSLRYVHHESPDGGSVAMDAHAEWTLPWTLTSGNGPTTLFFTGKNLVLKGDGEAKLALGDGSSNSTKITLFPDKIDMYLYNKDGEGMKSYVTIDCNGFKSMNLEGEFHFKKDIMQNTLDGSIPSQYINDDPKDVIVPFRIYLTDLNDMLIEASIPEEFQTFKLKATGDIKYTATTLVADFSTIVNSSNFQFPKFYTSPFGNDNETSNYWTGFYIKDFVVDIKEEFPEMPIDSITAKDLLIDETGVSGYFSALISDDKSILDNETVNAKFKELSLGFQSSKVTSGGLSGSVTIKPLVDDNGNSLTMELGGSVCKNGEKDEPIGFKVYAKVERDLHYHLPFIDKTNITIGQGSQIEYNHGTGTLNDLEHKNSFTLTMNGGLDVENKLIEIKGLRFEGMKISSASPHFSPGTFSVNSIDSPALHGLPFGIKSFSANGTRKRNGKEEALLSPTVYLQIIPKESQDDDKQGASVEADFDLVSSIDKKWEIKGVEVHRIKVDINYSVFNLSGEIEGYKDHQIFGDGFSGSLAFGMKTPRIGCQVDARFGSTKWMPKGAPSSTYPYKYWFVSVDADVPSILMFPPSIFLDNVSLAAYSKVAVEYDKEKCKVSKDKIVPDKRTKFGIHAGIGFYGAQKNLVNAKVDLGMEFSSSGGLSTLSLNGHVGIVGSGASNSFMEGSVECQYDFLNEIFSFNVDAKPGKDIRSFVDGNAHLEFLTKPGSWHCYAGTNANPIYLELIGIMETKAYMMLGDGIPTVLAPMDPSLSEQFNVNQSTATMVDHSEDFNSGSGFAFGAAMKFSFHPSAFLYADLGFMGGVDVIVYKNECDCGHGTKFRASGRIYTCMHAGAGVSLPRRDYEVVGFTAASELMAEVPKPVYVHGHLDFDYSLLNGLISGHGSIRFRRGESCRTDPDTDGKARVYTENDFDEVTLDVPVDKDGNEHPEELEGY